MPPILTLVFFTLGTFWLVYAVSGRFRGEKYFEPQGQSGEYAQPARPRVHWQCPGPLCHTENHGHARYCRTCGRRRQ